MIKVKNKYVYEVNSMENFYGMIPLNLYISIIYFNNGEEFKNIFLSLEELANFITECVVELLTREKIDFSNINMKPSDMFISSSPSRGKDSSKTLVLRYNENKKIVISEIRFYNSDSSIPLECLKMKDVNKEELLNLVLSASHLASSIIQDMYVKCSSSKKVNVIDNKIDVEEKNEDNNYNDDPTDEKFNLNNYKNI